MDLQAEGGPPPRCLRKTIDRLRARGELVAIRLGDGQTARVRIEVASLEAYESRQSGAATQAERHEDSLPIPALDKLRAAKASRRASGRRPLPRLQEAA